MYGEEGRRNGEGKGKHREDCDQRDTTERYLLERRKTRSPGCAISDSMLHLMWMIIAT
jgi:hypothetical protein